MFESMITQTVRVTYDRCGKPAGVDQWFATVPEARAFAEQMQFSFSTFSSGGCAHETCFCKTCHDEAIKTAFSTIIHAGAK